MSNEYVGVRRSRRRIKKRMGKEEGFLFSFYGLFSSFSELCFPDVGCVCVCVCVCRRGAGGGGGGRGGDKTSFWPPPYEVLYEVRMMYTVAMR